MGEFVSVVSQEEIPDGEMAVFSVRGKAIAVARSGSRYFAFDDTCTHKGCSLSEGELQEASVVCPCHFGHFDLTTGEVLDGPPPAPIGIYATRLNGTTLEVEL